MAIKKKKKHWSHQDLVSSYQHHYHHHHHHHHHQKDRDDRGLDQDDSRSKDEHLHPFIWGLALATGANFAWAHASWALTPMHSPLRAPTPWLLYANTTCGLRPAWIFVHNFACAHIEFLKEPIATGSREGRLQLAWPRDISFIGGAKSCHTKQKFLPPPCLKPAPVKTPKPRTEPHACTNWTLRSQQGSTWFHRRQRPEAEIHPRVDSGLAQRGLVSPQGQTAPRDLGSDHSPSGTYW